MTDQTNPRPSAAIIAFPARPAPAEDPGERLRRALATLDRAIKAQRAAVADWRTAIGDLGGTMGALGTAMAGYQTALGDLNGRVTTLGDAARRLQAQAAALEEAASR